jgi:hypothetical protein
MIALLSGPELRYLEFLMHRVTAQLPPCLIGLQACSGAHEWAHQFQVERRSRDHLFELCLPSRSYPTRPGAEPLVVRMATEERFAGSWLLLTSVRPNGESSGNHPPGHAVF